MKRFALPLAAFVLFAFAACDKKTNEPPVPTFAEEIAGTYNGYSKVSYFNITETHENQKVVITANTNGTVNLTFADKDNEEWSWGEFKLNDLEVTKSAGTYKISGENNDLYVDPMGGEGEPAGPYSYTMEGNIVSKTDAGITFIVALGGMGDINIVFTTGTAPDEG